MERLVVELPSLLMEIQFLNYFNQALSLLYKEEGSFDIIGNLIASKVFKREIKLAIKYKIPHLQTLINFSTIFA